MGGTSSTISEIVNLTQNQIEPSMKEAEIQSWRPGKLKQGKTIGVSNIGKVIKATKHKSDTHCAIKIFEYINREDSIYKYAKEKAEYLVKGSGLGHPNILKTYLCEAMDIEINFALNSKFVIVMELLPQNLRQYLQLRIIKNEYFNEMQLLSILMQLSSALMHLEKIGIYHHNVKEENIFVIDNGEKSKFIIGDMDICHKPMMKGDPNNVLYYAPEMRSANFTHKTHENIFKSDVYALAIVIVKLAKLMEKFKIEDRDTILTHVQELNKNYPKLHKILTNMVERNVERRVSSEEVFKYTQGYIFEIQKVYDFPDDKLSSVQKKIKTKIEEGDKLIEFEDLKLAIQCFDEAQNLIFEGDNQLNFCDRLLNARCLQQKAYTYSKLKDIKNALNFYQKSLEVRKMFLDNHNVEICYYEIGSLHFRMEDYQIALIYLIKCYHAYLSQTENNNLNSESQSPKNILIVQVKYLDKIGATYEKLQDYVNSLQNYIESLIIIKKVKGEKNDMYTKKIRIIASIFKKIGNIEKAKELTELANQLEVKVFNE